MIRIDYPPHEFRLKNEGGRDFIFDEWRRTWVRLTPEEWVRQNFINYLVQSQHYPPSMIAVEKEIRLGELKKRFDILVYDRSHKPWLLVECKAAHVALDEKVLQQVLRYRMSVEANYLLLTNGAYCMGWGLQEANAFPLAAVPDYAEE